MINLRRKHRNIYESNSEILFNCQINNMQDVNNTKNWQNVRKFEFLYIVDKGKQWYSHFRNNLAEFSDTTYKTNL